MSVLVPSEYASVKIICTVCNKTNEVSVPINLSYNPYNQPTIPSASARYSSGSLTQPAAVQPAVLSPHETLCNTSSNVISPGRNAVSILSKMKFPCNIFVLSPGRSGSETFAVACKHLTNYSSGMCVYIFMFNFLIFHPYPTLYHISPTPLIFLSFLLTRSRK